MFTVSGGTFEAGGGTQASFLIGQQPAVIIAGASGTVVVDYLVECEDSSNNVRTSPKSAQSVATITPQPAPTTSTAP